MKLKLIFNFWRKYPRKKPKKGGYYLCTVRENEREYVTRLHYSDWQQTWVNVDRQSVFDGYQVFLPGRGIVEETRMRSDVKCDMTANVVAWKHLPMRKGWWWR